MSERLLTPDDAAAVLGVSRSWIYKHVDSLPVVRLGNGPKPHIRIDPVDLRAWLKAGARSRPA